MDNKKFEEYLSQRYTDQINWYSYRASVNKQWYQVFQWGVIILSALIPVIVALDLKTQQWTTVSISILLAIGAAALKTFKFQENWINYRTVSETLKKEKYFYDAGIGGYDETEDAEALFVEQVESMISRENSLQVTIHRQQEEGEKASRKKPTNN